MKLKQLKKMLDSLSKEELEKDLIVVANDRYFSGVGEAKKSREKLFYDGSDDPFKLKNLTEMKEEYDNEEIEGMEIVLNRGEFFIELP